MLAEHCLTPDQMLAFLNIINIPVDMTNEIISIPTKSGEIVKWIWQEAMGCFMLIKDQRV